MKNLLLLALGVGFVLATAGCASEKDKAAGRSPISGQVGVQVASKDTSRVRPEHPELNPPPY